MWSRIQAALEEPQGARDVAPDADPVLDSPPVPWPLFLALLFANGWFLRPVPFDQRPGEDTIPQRQRSAMLRIPLFVTAWIAAGLLLPLVVALAFAGWVAKVVPGIRLVVGDVSRLASEVHSDGAPTNLRMQTVQSRYQSKPSEPGASCF